MQFSWKRRRTLTTFVPVALGCGRLLPSHHEDPLLRGLSFTNKLTYSLLDQLLDDFPPIRVFCVIGVTVNVRCCIPFGIGA